MIKISKKEFVLLNAVSKYDSDFEMAQTALEGDDGIESYDNVNPAFVYVEMKAEYSSDLLHEAIRAHKYELAMIGEREPKGLVRLRIVRYLSYEEMQSGTSPMADMQDGQGWTLREALLDALYALYTKGVLHDGK